MSVKALTIVFDSTVGSSTLKSVLTAIADRVDDRTGLCFPSIADTVARTELDRKTVIEKMSFLAAEKILIDTGQRAGRTKQVIVWLFDFQRLMEFSDAQKKQSQKRDGSENGTGTNFLNEEARSSAETVPKTGHGTTIDPSFEPPPGGGAGESNSGAPTKPPFSDEELEAFAEAAVWYCRANGGTIQREPGYKFAVRKRIREAGRASPEDIEALAAHRRAMAGAGGSEGARLPAISQMTPATPQQLAAAEELLQRVRRRVRGSDGNNDRPE